MNYIGRAARFVDRCKFPPYEWRVHDCGSSIRAEMVAEHSRFTITFAPKRQSEWRIAYPSGSTLRTSGTGSAAEAMFAEWVSEVKCPTMEVTV